MKTIPIMAAFIILFAVLTSCSSSGNSSKEVFEHGKLIPKIACKQDSSITYSLYLPDSYDTTKVYPVIFAFDAHGDGTKPVALFKEQAAKYGYIVVGSNTSKNGLSWDVTHHIFKVTLADVQSRFSINNARIYTSGFSGGARVASSIAILDGGIAGVVGFSAGFPNLNQPITHPFDYLGIVGNSDFNYNEMVALDQALASNGFNHYLLIFNGKHEWPSPELIPDVFYWLEFCAYRNQTCISDKKTIDAFKAACQLQIEQAIHEKDMYREYQTTLKLISFLHGISDVEKIKEKQLLLEKSPKLKTILAQVNDEVKKEQSLQQYYQKAMLNENLDWWKKEVAKLNKIISSNPKNRISFLYNRILSFLSMSGYSFTNQSIRENNLVNAQRFVSIYQWVDPTNSDASYFQTLIFAKQNKDEEAINALSVAINQGFNDAEKINNEPAFSSLQKNPRFKELVQKISKIE